MLSQILFQFHHGTIGSLTAQVLDDVVISISIPPWYDWKLYICVLKTGSYFHFNSTMVRLEGLSFRYAFPSTRFQFHHGTIGRRGRYCITIKFLVNFNSTMVRLEEVTLMPYSVFAWYFNSTMVRLEAYASITAQTAIPNFNSTMVRLEVRNKM